MKAKLIKAGRIVALLLAAVILLNETGFVFAQEGEKAKAPAVETEGEAQPGPAENGPAENGPTEDGSEEKGSEENDPEKKDPDEPGPQSPAASGAQTGGEEPDPAEGGAAEVPGTEVSETRVLEWKNESRTVVVTAEAEEAFTEGTSLHVTPVVEGDAYTGCMDLLYPKQEAEAEEKAAELYQLQFRNSDGEEADLTGPVRVTMTYSDGLSFAASEEQPLTVARLEEKSPENEGEVSWELIPVEAEIKEAENKEIENQETENQEAEHKSEGGIALFSAAVEPEAEAEGAEAGEPEAEKSEEEPALQVAFTVEESSRVVLYAAPRAAAVLSGTYLVRILNGSCTRDGKCTLQKETIEISLADLGQDASNASNEPETQKSAILERIKTKLETEGYPEFVDVTELYVGTADIKGDKRITDSNKRVDSAKLYEVKSAYVSNSTVQAEYVVRGTLKTGAINDDLDNFPCDTNDMLNTSRRWCFYVRATVNDKIKENLVETASTKDFITLRMFDYTEQVNKHADLVVQATSGNNNSWQMNPNKVAGICDTQSVKEGFGFWESERDSGFGKGTLYNPNGPGRVSQVSLINERTKGMVRPKLENGMPVLNVNGENISLAYLFDPDTANRTEGARYLGEGDGLFTLNGGTYSYDSGRNAAHYDESDHVFHVYNYTYKVGDSSGFMPYNFASKKAESQTSEKRVNDYWFGMTATAVFLQPENGILPNNQEMTFEFSGDDDVWVFIDDVLVLDLGGVHAAIRGNINFANGQVGTWSALAGNPQRENSNIKQKFIDAGYDTDGINKIFKTNFDTFQDNSLHTLSFFYLERGAGESNCKLEFNLLEPEFIALGKEVKWDEADPSLYKDDEILEKEKDREYPFKLWKKTATGEDGIPGLKYYGARKIKRVSWNLTERNMW